MKRVTARHFQAFARYRGLRLFGDLVMGLTPHALCLHLLRRLRSGETQSRVEIRQLQSPILLQQSFLGRMWTPKINQPGTGINLRGKGNSDSKLCHDPEDGAGDQSLVGDDTERLCLKSQRHLLEGGQYGTDCVQL